MPRILRPTRTKGPAPSHAPPDERFSPGITLSRALGWFSIGLGLAELLVPEEVSRWTGVRNTRLLQAYGVREIVCGVGILRSQRPIGWMWARVVGDACDIRTLSGVALADTGDDGERARAALMAVAGVTALDVINATGLSTAAAMEG